MPAKVFSVDDNRTIHQNATAEQLSSSLGSQAIPENIRQLTSLVSKRGSSLDEISQLICQDRRLTQRLLRAANPRALTEEDYTVTSVDAALMRAGIGCALLLSMSDPLIRAVRKTFHTMLGIDLKEAASGVLAPLETEHVLSEVAFEGKATGKVALRLSGTTAQNVAAAVLGFLPVDPADTADVVGELSNMVADNFKSSLCEAGLTCKLGPPQVGRTHEFKLRALSGGLVERIGFRGVGTGIFVDTLVNPWG